MLVTMVESEDDQNEALRDNNMLCHQRAQGPW